MKISGKKITSVDGLGIYINHIKPKKSGKERLWISVRQEEPKRWRVAATLSYVNAVDVRFEKEKTV